MLFAALFSAISYWLLANGWLMQNKEFKEVREIKAYRKKH
jgi:hypothetical protein